MRTNNWYLQILTSVSWGDSILPEEDCLEIPAEEKNLGKMEVFCSSVKDWKRLPNLHLPPAHFHPPILPPCIVLPL